MNIPEGWALELGECVDGDSYASVSPDPSACGELIYRSRNPVVFAFLLALRAAAPPAPAAQAGDIAALMKLADDYAHNYADECVYAVLHEGERMHGGSATNRSDLVAALQARQAPAAQASEPTTPNASLPPIGEGPRAKIHVTVEVPSDWERRLDMQWVLEREIHADRWSWNWPQAQQGLQAPLSDDARIELVVAVHTLASHFENALYAFRDDDEARRKAEGDIDHAMRIAAKWNWNGITAPRDDCDYLAAAPSAPAARLIHGFSSIDCEALIAAVLPGGSICDPQQVADSIRSYLNAWPPAPAAQSAQTDPGEQEG